MEKKSKKINLGDVRSTIVAANMMIKHGKYNEAGKILRQGENFVDHLQYGKKLKNLLK